MLASYCIFTTVLPCMLPSPLPSGCAVALVLSNRWFRAYVSVPPICGIFSASQASHYVLRISDAGAQIIAHGKVSNITCCGGDLLRNDTTLLCDPGQHDAEKICLLPQTPACTLQTRVPTVISTITVRPGVVRHNVHRKDCL